MGGQAGLAGLGDFAADLNLDQNPALSMLSELGRMHDRNVEIESSPALESLDNLAHLDHLEPLEPASMEPVTPRECSVEGCTFFAGAAGLCSECYREEFGREPPEPPPFKPMPPGYYDDEDDDEEGDAGDAGDAGNASKKKKKKRKKKKKGDAGNEDDGAGSDGARANEHAANNPGSIADLPASGEDEPPPVALPPQKENDTAGERRRLEIYNYLEEAGRLRANAP